MTLGDLGSLVVALGDLKAVDAIVKAINANLPKTGPLGTIPQGWGPGTQPAMVDHAHEDPEPGRRQTLHPAPQIVSGGTVTQSAAVHRAPDAFEPQLAPITVYEPCYKGGTPLPPLWRSLPPIVHEAVLIRPKVFVQKVDLLTKGTLIDLFL